MRRFFLILLLLLAVGAGGWYFYLKPKQGAETSTSSNGFKSFFSLGNNTTAVPGQLPDTTSADTTVPVPVAGSPFIQLSAGPVAGFTAYTVTNTVLVPAADPKQKPTKQTVTDHIVRYVSRSNGYVYEIKNDDIPTQISNIFIPNIYEAYFADNNQTAILRFLRDDNQTIATYSVPIPPPNPDGTRTQIEGTYFPDNIRSLVVSPDGKVVARLTTDDTNSIITTSDSKGGSVKEVLRNPFHEWLLSWQNQIYAQSKASGLANGFLYRVDAGSKRLLRVIGSISGMTTSISPKGTYVLYSESTQNGFSTKLLNTKTSTVKDLGVSILPEKCSWLIDEEAVCGGSDVVAAATYPDTWYQGLTTFTDKLYRVNTTTGLITALNNGNGTDYDIVNPEFDESQNRLYFIDKNTGYLWKYSL